MRGSTNDGMNNGLHGSMSNDTYQLDVSNNYLSGEVPKFRQTVFVKSDGNPNIVRNNSYPGATPDNIAAKVREEEQVRIRILEFCWFP